MKKFYFLLSGVVAFLLTMGASLANVFGSNMIETPLQTHLAQIQAIAQLNTNYTPALPKIKVTPHNKQLVI